MLYLTDAEVALILNPQSAAEAIEGAFRSLADGSSAVQQRVRTITPAGKLSMVGGVMVSADRAGAKVYPTTKDGRFGFVVLLFALSSGEPLAVMEGSTLTEIRTAATSVVAARYLAPPNPEVLVVFGAGRQAVAHALAFADEFDLAEIRLVNRRDAADVERRIKQSTGVPTIQMTGDALEGADLVITATRSTEALFDGRALPRRCHITAVGATTPESRELDAKTIARSDWIVVESISQAQVEAGDLLLAEREGTSVWERVVELADLVSGQTTRPGGPEQITLYKSLGIGLEDVAVADAVYRAAMAQSVGRFLGE
ncbi:MAG: ornithine cyclodeaminase family protein [Acidimicrobiia bacterium]